VCLQDTIWGHTAQLLLDAATDSVSGEHTHQARVGMNVIDKGHGKIEKDVLDGVRIAGAQVFISEIMADGVQALVY
jgi:hypothetical protein